MNRQQVLSGLLAAALCLGTAPAALAASAPSAAVSDSAAATRDTDLDALMTLLGRHPDLYHANSKAVFDRKRAEIRAGLDQMSDLDFAIALSELAALAQDSHTKVSIGSTLSDHVRMLPIGLTVVDEGLLLTRVPAGCEQALGGILTAVGGVPLDEIARAIAPMLSSDNAVYQYRQFAQTFYVYDILAHYGVLSTPEDIVLTVQQDGRTVTITLDALDQTALAQLEMAALTRRTPETAADKRSYYWAKPLDARTLYIQYNRCQQDPALPMETFVKQVSQQLDQNGYDRVIVDLRNNGGGSDGVIVPLMQELEERHCQDGLALYTLIGANTFSSALINAVELKQTGATIVGTPTGGSVDHFGAIQTAQLPGSGLTVSLSSKFIDMATLIPAAQPYGVQPFQPDVPAPQTRADYLAGVDSAVQAVLARTDDAGTPAETLSRGALAVRLGRHEAARTGQALDTPVQTFSDVCIVSYTAPYISWAAQAGIMRGDSGTHFDPGRAVTRQELAVVLARYADRCGRPLADGTAAAPSDGAAIAPWAREAVQAVTAAGLMELTGGAFLPDERVTPGQAEAALQALETWIT